MRFVSFLIRVIGLALVIALMAMTAILELFAVCVFAGGLPDSWGPVVKLVLILVGLVISGVISLAIHEGGHLLAGAAAGFKPLLAHVGPLTLKPVDGSWRLVWDRTRFWLLARALVVNRPASRGELLTFALGGCVANFAFCIPLVLVALLAPPLCRNLIWLVALNSFLTAVVNLAPLRLLGYDSDGLCIARLLWQRDVKPFNVEPWQRLASKIPLS